MENGGDDFWGSAGKVLTVVFLIIAIVIGVRNLFGYSNIPMRIEMPTIENGKIVKENKTLREESDWLAGRTDWGTNQPTFGDGWLAVGDRWVDEHGRLCEMPPSFNAQCCVLPLKPTKLSASSIGCR